MIRKSASLLATAVLAGALTVGLFAAPAEAALRHIDGTVVSKNSDNRTFKLTTQGGNTVRIKVNSATKFEGVSFGSLHKGMRIEVDAQSTDSGLLAKHVEPRGGGGGGADDNGGGGGGGSDDGPNHT